MLGAWPGGAELGGNRAGKRVLEARLGIWPREGLTTPRPGGFQDVHEESPWAVTGVQSLGPGGGGQILEKSPGAQ